MADGSVVGVGGTRIAARVAAAALVAVALLSSQSSARAADLYTLSGTVIAGSMPISDASVAVLDGTGAVLYSGNTDSAGHYSIGGIADGAYTVEVTPSPGSGWGRSTIPDVAIHADTALNVTLVPAASSRLSGVVRDASGQPVAGVLVQLCCQLTGGEYTATTNAAGAYSFQVAPGSYYVVLQRGGADPARLPTFFTIISQNFTLPTGDTVRDLTLPSVHTLTVHVHDTDATPLPGVSIQSTEALTALPFQLGTGMPLREPSRSGGGTQTTDAAGVARFRYFTTTSGATLTADPPSPDLQPIRTGTGALTQDVALVLRFVPSDATPPTVTGTSDRPATAGWWNAPVTITWTAVDPAPSSGAPTPPPATTVSAEGADQVITSDPSCDPAGNCATGRYTVSIDRTPPTITADLSPPRPGSGWTNSATTVTFSCTDTLSGIGSCPERVTIAGEGADQTVSATAADRAGNTATTTVTVSTDKTAPIIAATRTAANGNGWNNGPVTVTFTCTDALSGVAACPDPVTRAEGGADQSATGTTTDRAGNTATVTLNGINIDTTPPVVVVTGPVNGRTYLQGRVPAAGCTTADALSGVAANASPTTVGNGNGTFTVTCAGAVDIAGNTASSASVTYTTIAPVRPIANNSRSGVLNSSITATAGAGGVAVGETVTVAVATGTFTGTASCGDARSNAYTVVVDRNTANGRLFICTARVTTALAAGDTVTANYPGFGGLSLISVNAISPLATTSTADSTSSATGNSANPNSGNATATPNALLLGVIAHNSTPTITPGVGFTAVGPVTAGTGSGRRSLTPEYRLVSTPGSYAATATLSGGQQWRAALLTYPTP